MDLITHTKKSCRAYRGKPQVRITTNGTISFSKTFARLAGFIPGDLVIFHQDKNQLTHWYMEKTDDPENGLCLRFFTNRNLMFTSKSLAKIIMKSLDMEGQSRTFRMSTKPTETKYYAILTKMVK